jgi:hypothetical protein
MCLLGWATVVGFVRFVTHRQQVTWERVTVPATAHRAGDAMGLMTVQRPIRGDAAARTERVGPVNEAIRPRKDSAA